jgi:hypothetical protein
LFRKLGVTGRKGDESLARFYSTCPIQDLSPRPHSPRLDVVYCDLVRGVRRKERSDRHEQAYCTQFYNPNFRVRLNPMPLLSSKQVNLDLGTALERRS